MIYKKNTLLIKDSHKKHLYIVISDPNEKGQFLLVSLRTYRKTQREDNSCLLKTGCHPFVKHDTFIDYHKVLINTSEEIEKSIEIQGSNIIKPLENVSDDVLEMIQNGARISGRFPIQYRVFFKYF